MGTLMVAWETAIALSHFHVCSPFATKVVTKSFPDTARVYDDTFPLHSPLRARALSPTSASDDATALSDQRRCTASYRCLYATPPPLPLSVYLCLQSAGEKCLRFQSKYYREFAFWHFISTIYPFLSWRRMHISCREKGIDSKATRCHATNLWVNQQRGGGNVYLWFKITRDNYLVVALCLFIYIPTMGRPRDSHG